MAISELCIKLAFLPVQDGVVPADREGFEKLMYKTSSPAELQNALKTLMRMMQAVYGKPVILLMDEYDVPLAKAQENGYYREMLDLIRGLMSASLKTNEYLKFAVITGCLRISKESIFTGVNNFACYSVMDRRFSRFFGFTPDEVALMLEELQLPDRLDALRQWYDGYIFGDTEVFCPWDVVSFVSEVLYDPAAEPENYWANTSGNAILSEFVRRPEISVAEKFEVLLNGGTIAEELSKELTYDQLGKTEKSLWSVLLMTGYLSKAEKTVPAKGKIRLKIPNREVAELFRDAVVSRFEQSLDTSTVDDFLHAMWAGNEGAASSCLSDILWDSISYFDYGEEYYHGILNGLFTSRGYAVDSNDEEGLGRLDLRVRDRAGRRAILLEFKRSKNEDHLEADCLEAIDQIIQKGYGRRMPDGYLQQLVYGVAFFGKRALVRRMS